MKEVLRFKNMQDMVNEADEYLSTVKDEDVKVCAKFLLISCYAYINEFINDESKKTYQSLSMLVKYELVRSEYVDGVSKYQSIMLKAQDRTICKKIYALYSNCPEEIKVKAQMQLMNKLLPTYFKS